MGYTAKPGTCTLLAVAVRAAHGSVSARVVAAECSASCLSVLRLHWIMSLGQPANCTPSIHPQEASIPNIFPVSQVSLLHSGFPVRSSSFSHQPTSTFFCPPPLPPPSTWPPPSFTPPSFLCHSVCLYCLCPIYILTRSLGPPFFFFRITLFCACSLGATPPFPQLFSPTVSTLGASTSKCVSPLS
jgi:hypothetical protein